MSESNCQQPLAVFIQRMTELLGQADGDEALILNRGAGLLRELIRDDAWLAERYRRPSPDHYQQYLLHCDPQARFSVVSFVWGPGQRTPVHDHTVWGLVGMLVGAERSTSFERRVDGSLISSPPTVLEPGDVEAVSPRIGDIHQVENALRDRISISIHVYGADIGRVERHVYDMATGDTKTFISGYARAG